MTRHWVPAVVVLGSLLTAGCGGSAASKMPTAPTTPAFSAAVTQCLNVLSNGLENYLDGQAAGGTGNSNTNPYGPDVVNAYGSGSPQFRALVDASYAATYPFVRSGRAAAERAGAPYIAYACDVPGASSPSPPR